LNCPTLASLIEHATADDPELTLAIIHSFNQWMLEHWSYNYENRVFSTPLINLSEVDGVQRELEYLLNNGVEVALIKPGPVNGIRGWRSPALPEFDPFWRDAEALPSQLNGVSSVTGASPEPLGRRHPTPSAIATVPTVLQYTNRKPLVHHSIG
jgi:hypothetical protein